MFVKDANDCKRRCTQSGKNLVNLTIARWGNGSGLAAARMAVSFLKNRT